MGCSSKLLVLLSTRFPRLHPRPSFLLARPSYSSPPSLLAALGAQHRFPWFPIACFRPCHGPLPVAASWMHTQTSVRVDFGEPSVAPIYGTASFHPWPEWLKLVEHLTAGGYVDRRVSPAVGEDDDAFSVPEELPEEFKGLAGACLLYARERPGLLRSLSKRDIEVVVENGSPSLFRNGLNTVRRMKSFISDVGSQVLESEQACTADLMRYLLSYSCNSLTSTGGDKTSCRELVESSVRNLLCELVKISTGTQESNLTDSTAHRHPLGYEQAPNVPRQNIEMKRGDWICPRCNFMNFARNVKCLECDETRPKKQLTSGEWECPHRNMTCLRCDCKRPGEIPSGRKPSIEQLLNSGNVDKTEIERRLAENDEKAERWFSKVSQLDDSSDLSSAIPDEDFPEIMPLRKGTNRFVISTRKTPLERRLANAQYRSNLGNEGSHMGNGSSGGRSDKISETAFSQTLDRILGRSSATSETDLPVASGISKDARNSVSREPNITGNRFISPGSRDSGHASFVPLSAGMFHNKPNTEVQTSDRMESASVNAGHLAGTLSGGFRSGVATNLNNVTRSVNLNNQAVNKTTKDSFDAAERWSTKSAELPVNGNLQSATSDNSFSRTVPTNEEDNQFAINRGSHFVTPPNYKRRIAMEQANNSNFVPFVPFPPDYFAKKDKQPEDGSSSEKYSTVSSPSVSVGNSKITPQVFEENRIGCSYGGGASNIGQTGRSGDIWNSGLSRSSLDERKVSQQSWSNNAASHGGGAFARDVTANGVSASGNPERQQVENAQKMTESWNHGFPGKSLEGSAVTEPDPLDMSEEAKAQRWFRRVAQIKDISELSKIPDEDFPEIMPMRKGVNRFVVSKRKTPLERRLTSPQYRRNLPIVSYEPGKEPAKE